jgi:hypothetical protein
MLIEILFALCFIMVLCTTVLCLVCLYLVRLIAEWMKLHHTTHLNLSNQVKRVEDGLFKLEDRLKRKW